MTPHDLSRPGGGTSTSCIVESSLTRITLTLRLFHREDGMQKNSKVGKHTHELEVLQNHVQNLFSASVFNSKLIFAS